MGGLVPPDLLWVKLSPGIYTKLFILEFFPCWCFYFGLWTLVDKMLEKEEVVCTQADKLQALGQEREGNIQAAMSGLSCLSAV